MNLDMLEIQHFSPIAVMLGRKRRFWARLDLWAGDDRAGFALLLAIIVAHVLLWSLILTILKAGQDIHFDVAEAYAWGQKFLLGYGKHPPLSGWIAGLWFAVFPATDWSTYALAMATVGCGLLVCFFIALHVVDRRRALFVVVMLSLYPIFNFKGFKYNPDLLQICTLPLVVLAYLSAFEKRSAMSGIWLGLAAAAALMTKYWALTMIGAVGLVALIHPQRSTFLSSPAPWVAMSVVTFAMLPHLWWLQHVDFLPLLYARDSYSSANSAKALELAFEYINHNLALLFVPVILALIALMGRRYYWPPLARGVSLEPASAELSSAMQTSQRLNVWIIQLVVAIGPPLGALSFTVNIKTDWGIPMFFLVPLALVALPGLPMKKSALGNIVVIWLSLTLATLAASPLIATRTMNVFSTHSFKSELARQLTEHWRTRFGTPWAVVAGTTEIAAPMTFYSTDHPSPFTPGEVWSSGLSSLDEARLHGFVGICDTTDYRLPTCESWMAANASDAERLTISTRRVFAKTAGPLVNWNVYIVPPKR